MNEVKSHLSTVCHGTQHTTFRSQKPAGIYQEAWALVAAHNLLRDLMVDAGRKRVAPRVVKVKMSNFKLKRKWHRTQFRDFAAELRLVDMSLAG